MCSPTIILDYKQLNTQRNQTSKMNILKSDCKLDILLVAPSSHYLPTSSSHKHLTRHHHPLPFLPTLNLAFIMAPVSPFAEIRVVTDWANSAYGGFFVSNIPAAIDMSRTISCECMAESLDHSFAHICQMREQLDVSFIESTYLIWGIRIRHNDPGVELIRIRVNKRTDYL